MLPTPSPSRQADVSKSTQSGLQAPRQRFMQQIMTRKNLAIILATTLFTTFSAYALDAKLPKTFQALTEVQVRPGHGGAAMATLQHQAFLSRIIDGLSQDELADIATTNQPQLNPRSTALENLRQNLELHTDSQRSVIDIVVAANTPDSAVLIANKIASLYVSTDKSAASARQKTETRRFAKRLSLVRDELSENEKQLEDLTQQTKSSQATSRQIGSRPLEQMTARLSEARLQTLRARTVLRQTKQARNVGISAELGVKAVQSPTVASLRARLLDISQRQATLGVSLLPSHPTMREIKSQRTLAIRELNAELDRVIATAKLSVDRAVAHEEALAKRLARVTTEAEVSAEQKAKLQKIKREIASKRQTYSNLLMRQTEAEKNLTNRPAPVKILKFARTDSAPTRSLPLMLIFASMLGLIGGTAFALRQDKSDPRLRNSAQVLAATGLERIREIPSFTESVLESVRATGGKALRFQDQEHGNGLLPAFFSRSTKTPAAQAVSDLAYDILKKLRTYPNRMVLFTGLEHDEAKSTIAFNVALAAAHRGQRVLLIDADIQKKSVSEKIGAADKPGLMNILNGEAHVTTAIQHDTPFPIAILPAGTTQGTARPSKLFQVIERRLQLMTRGFDLVIIDGCLTRETRQLRSWLNMAELPYLVVREGLTAKEKLASMYHALRQPGRKPFDVVFVTDD